MNRSVKTLTCSIHVTDLMLSNDIGGILVKLAKRKARPHYILYEKVDLNDVSLSTRVAVILEGNLIGTQVTMQRSSHIKLSDNDLIRIKNRIIDDINEHHITL